MNPLLWTERYKAQLFPLMYEVKCMFQGYRQDQAESGTYPEIIGFLSFPILFPQSPAGFS